jgi:hypothetical protein
MRAVSQRRPGLAVTACVFMAIQDIRVDADVRVQDTRPNVAVAHEAGGLTSVGTHRAMSVWRSSFASTPVTIRESRHASKSTNLNCMPSTAEALARYRSGGQAVQIYNRIAVAQDPDWVLLNSDPEIGAWRMPNAPRAMLYWREHRQNPLVPVCSEWVLLHDIYVALRLVIVARWASRNALHRLASCILCVCGSGVFSIHARRRPRCWMCRSDLLAARCRPLIAHEDRYVASRTSAEDHAIRHERERPDAAVDAPHP